MSTWRRAIEPEEPSAPRGQPPSVPDTREDDMTRPHLRGFSEDG
jgi:hypothetical protein